MMKKEEVNSIFGAMSFPEKLITYYTMIADFQDVVKSTGKSDTPEANAILEVLEEMSAFVDNMEVEDENETFAFMLGGLQIAGIRNLDEDMLKADIRGMLAEMQAHVKEA